MRCSHLNRALYEIFKFCDNNKLNGVQLDTLALWRLSPEKFNEWRAKNDYPRIFALFEQKLPHFNDWLESQDVSQDTLFNHGFARLVSSEEPLVLCFYSNGGTVKLFEQSFEKLPSIRKAGWIKSEKEYEPYFYWLKAHYGNELYREVKRDFRISSWIGGRPQFMREHFLLNLGNVSIERATLSGRMLDFTCLDNLRLVAPFNNQDVYLWSCSAVGMQIKGGLAFLNCKNTILSDHGRGEVKRELILSSGSFQDLHFLDCDVEFHAERCTLRRCSLTGEQFDATLEYTKVEGFEFKTTASPRKAYPSSTKFYARAKSLFSSIGNDAEAGKYYYKERKSEMLSLLFPKQRNWEVWNRLNSLGKVRCCIASYIKFVVSLLDYLVWGFGEKPARCALISVALVLVSASLYYFIPESATYDSVVKSIYFSIVTFVTLGYGDISQNEPWLQLYSATQAFSGMVLMGLFLAGFASKSKRY